MLRRSHSAVFLNEFLDYFGEHTIATDFDHEGRLIVFSNPYLEFDKLVVNICENLVNIFHYHDHMEIVVYPFGNNNCVLISINPG
ncbi:hypothetical protein [Pedobacter boryungensis]|uniref:Uncharacterized protein n=1 Tax=Pedobacter boryungensis TaxID=869962 RepID=A0ABX2D9F9_9SPHI|nr:hypothetical protein [Pedobacter boryungensis]NQX30615.1 hypothetical protein [Pedobacter boryungensis]